MTALLVIQVATFVGLGACFLAAGDWRLGVAQMLPRRRPGRDLHGSAWDRRPRGREALRSVARARGGAPCDLRRRPGSVVTRPEWGGTA